MNNENVASLSPSTTDWVGSVDKKDYGIWADTALLLIFGGIPWQVGIYSLLVDKSSTSFCAIGEPNVKCSWSVLLRLADAKNYMTRIIKLILSDDFQLMLSFNFDKLPMTKYSSFLSNYHQ